MAIKASDAFGQRVGNLKLSGGYIPETDGRYAVHVREFTVTESTQDLQAGKLKAVPGFRVAARVQLVEDPDNPVSHAEPRYVAEYATSYFVVEGLRGYNPDDSNVVPPGADPNGWSGTHTRIRIDTENAVRLVRAVLAAAGVEASGDAVTDFNEAEAQAQAAAAANTPLTIVISVSTSSKPDRNGKFRRNVRPEID